MPIVAEEPKWPDVEMAPLVAVAAEPDELARMLGIELEFVDTFDQLDYCRLAAIRLSSGMLMLLIRHRGNPAPGTEVHAEVTVDTDSAIEEFLSESDVDPTLVKWRRGQDWRELEA